MKDRSGPTNDDPELASDALLAATCRIKGCLRPICRELFNGRHRLCSGHALESLAQFCEAEWEEDTLAEISEGEQAGAALRNRSGIGTKFRVSPGDDPLSR